MYLSDSKPIIVCGTGRSGTSIFTNLLNLHPSIFSFKWETQIFSGLPNLCDIANRSFNLKSINQFKERLNNHLFKRTVRPGTPSAYNAGLFEIISEEHIKIIFTKMETELHNATNRIQKISALRNFSFNLFEKATNCANAKRWCEKTPRNIIYAESILKILGNCQFINVIRDGRDVVSSILERRFWPVAKMKRHPLTAELGGEFTVKNAAIYWSNLIKLGMEKKELIGPKRWLDIKLEDLATQPQETWEVVLAFLGEDWEDSVLDANSVVLKRKPKGEISWANAAHIGRWQQDLTKEQKKAAEEIMSDELLTLGYELSS